MNIFLAGIIITVSAAIIASISLLTIPDNRQHCTFCPEIPSPTQTLQTANATTASVVDTQQISTSENDCGQFLALPEQHERFTVPVLLMDSNSTDCFKLTFTVSETRNPDHTYLLAILRQELNFHIGNYNVTMHGKLFSISPGKDYTKSFEISRISQAADSPANSQIGNDPTNYPVGTNFTETYMIKALPGAKGFYDYSIPGPICSHYPLAVGYVANQVNTSDFSKVNPFGPICMNLPFKIVAVQVSGMGYKQLQLEPIPLG